MSSSSLSTTATTTTSLPSPLSLTAPTAAAFDLSAAATAAWPRSLRWMYQLSQQPDANQLGIWIQQQRLRYDELLASNAMLLQEEKDGEKNGDTTNSLVNIDETDQQQLNHDNNTEATTTAIGSSNEAWLIDPLTAIVQEQEAREKRLGELELKYRKEKARQKRGLSTRHYDEDDDDDDDDDGDDNDEFDNGGNGGIAASTKMKKKNLQYLTDMMNVLDKDLHRLPPEHAAAIYSITPLSRRIALLRQVLVLHAHEHVTLGYRQGMHEICSHLMMVLEQDVYTNMTTTTTTTTTTATELQTNPIPMSPTQFSPSTTADPLNNDLTQLLLSSHDYVAHDTFVMLEIIMQWLGPAYEVVASSSSTTTTSSSNTPSNSASYVSKSPMELMATSVLTKVQQVDASLYHHLQRLHVPPQLYMTRWIRLMLAREVAHAAMVPLLWDVLLELQHGNLQREQQRKQQQTQVQEQAGGDGDVAVEEQQANRDNNHSTTCSATTASLLWMNLLETCAACLILLQRPLLLPTSSQASSSQPMETEDSIHILMNIPAMTNLTPLTTLLRHWVQQRQQSQDGDNNNNDGTSHNQYMAALLASLLPTITPSSPERRRLLSSSAATTSTSPVIGKSISSNRLLSHINPAFGHSRNNSGGTSNSNNNNSKAFSFQSVRQSLRAAAAPAGESFFRLVQDWAPPPPQPSASSSTATAPTSTAAPTTNTGAETAFRSKVASTTTPGITTPMKLSTPTICTLPALEDPLLRPSSSSTINNNSNSNLIVDFQSPRPQSSTNLQTQSLVGVEQPLSSPLQPPPSAQRVSMSSTNNNIFYPQQQPFYTPIQQQPTMSHTTPPPAGRWDGTATTNSNVATTPSSPWAATTREAWPTSTTTTTSSGVANSTNTPHHQASSPLTSLSSSPPKPATLRHQLVLYAQQLEHSVKILQDYCMEQQRQRTTTAPDDPTGALGSPLFSNLPNNNNNNQNESMATIPPQVWEALVDVDQVRKGLLAAATATRTNNASANKK